MTSRWLGLVLILPALLLLTVAACGGDDKAKKKTTPNTPEIIRVGGPLPTAAPDSAPAPPIISSGVGSTNLQVLPLIAAGSNAPALPGLTIRHAETSTVPADQAFVVLQLQRNGPLPFAALSAHDQEQAGQALTDFGVDKANFKVEANGGTYTPFTTVSVQTSTKDLQVQGKKILDALEAVLGHSQASGARFGLSDCRTALEPLRKQALAAAQDEATALAQVSGLKLGALTSVTQNINGSSGVSVTASNPCGGSSGSVAIPVPGNLQGFDSPATVTIGLELVATWSLGDSNSPVGLTATGSGKATAKADEAYVVITAGLPSGQTGPSPLTKKNRDDLTAKLKALKYKDDQIDIGTSPYGGPVAVSVEVALDKLPQAGKDITQAVEDVLGRSISQGVWFSHSNCTAVLTEARKQAALDARNAASSLARAASIQIGDLLAMAEVAQNPSVSPNAAPQNPCSDDVASLFVSNTPYGSFLQPFDAQPEFTVTSTIAATYAIAK